MSTKKLQIIGGLGSNVELDTTLAQEGKAADAKAVGDALANKLDISDLSKPDWNQNDETAPDYVLNRTHWVEQVMVEILLECQPAYDEDMQLFCVLENIPTFEVGKTYTVIWNGTEYECVAQDMGALTDGDWSGAGLGNLSVVGATDTGEPFAIMPNNGMLLVAPFDGTTELTLSIYQNNETVHKLPGKFLPGSVPVVPTATVGQTIVVQEVDENGKPTRWEAVDLPSGGAAIIDVLELPIENINENAFYRLATARFVANQEYADEICACHYVEALPETGEVCTDATMSFVIAYYSLTNNEAYGYVDSDLGAGLGLSAGWYPCSALCDVANITYGGIITDINDDPCDDGLRVLLGFDLYIYKNEWMKVPFAYEKAPKFDITWDGDMTDRSALDMSALGYSQGVYFVKVSDDVFETNDMIDWTMEVQSYDGSIDKRGIDQYSFDTITYPGAFTVDGCIVVIYDVDVTATALGIPTGIYTNGVYFWLYTEEGYVSNLTSSPRITKIDKKYLPNMDVDASSLGLHSVATSGNYNDLYNRPNLNNYVTTSTLNSHLSNYATTSQLSNYVTTTEVETMISNAIGSAIGGSY